MGYDGLKYDWRFDDVNYLDSDGREFEEQLLEKLDQIQDAGWEIFQFVPIGSTIEPGQSGRCVVISRKVKVD